MNRQNRNSLKLVLDSVPPGFLVDAKWLAAHAVGRSSIHDYHRDNWLEHAARGVYRRPYPNTDTVGGRDWKLAVLSAQWIMNYDFHLGGMSALTLEGHNHYLGLGRSANLYLYGNVPTWLPKLGVDAHVLTRRRQLFGSDTTGIDEIDFDPAAADAPSPWNWPIRRSTPERALLETLNELPENESFHTVDMMVQSLSTLRPGQLSKLLLACKSVKVKRLFFLFADRHAHRWLAHIDRDAIDLGSGPRRLVEGGRYAPEYQLMVPSEFAHPPGKGDADGA